MCLGNAAASVVCCARLESENVASETNVAADLLVSARPPVGPVTRCRFTDPCSNP